MSGYSLVDGTEASYSVAAGKTTVQIVCRKPINHRQVSCGTGVMNFHWVQQGKTQSWECEFSLQDPQVSQLSEAADSDGSQRLTIPMGDPYPAASLIQGNMVGRLVAPAVHVDVPFGADVWVFMIRSPWFPLKLQLARNSLSLQHEMSRIDATLIPSEGGSLDLRTTMTGTDFKSATVVVKRTLGQYTSTEIIGDIQAGVQEFTWKPILRDFDLLLVTKGSISESQLADLVKGLGGQVSSGIFRGGSVEGDFILCDGPAIDYKVVLRGHRGFLENPEDTVNATLSW